MKKIKQVIFYGIFLMLIGSNEIYANYTSGTNTVSRDIEFKLIVQNTLLIAKGEDIDFGKILKDSTVQLERESKLLIEADKSVKTIKLRYISGEDSEDLYRKIFIKRKAEEEAPIIFTDEVSEEKEEISVYFKSLDVNYDLLLVDGKKVKEIPIIAQIRGVENIKLGNYEGTMKIEVLIEAYEEEKGEKDE